MAINIQIEDKITKVEGVFEITQETEVVPFSLSNSAKIPELREAVSCKEIKKAVEHLGLVLLHRLFRDEIGVNNIISVIEFNVTEIIAKVKSLLAGKVRPGITKNGFGPIHASEVFEKMTKKKDDLNSLQALFIIASLQPYMEIVGLDQFVLQSEFDEIEVTDEKLNDVMRASRLFECFYACVGMCEEKKRSISKTDFFSVENWMIFLRSLKNLLNIEADRVEMFEESIEHLSVLLTASKLGITNKALVLYSDLLNSPEASALKDNHQIITRGIANLSSLPTILASTITLDKLRFDISNVFGAFNGSVYVVNSPFKLRGGSIGTYIDTNLKGQIRGSMLVAMEYVEHPIQVMKKLEESAIYYSYSTSGFTDMGKTITSTANNLFKLLLDSVVKSVPDVKYFAVVDHHTNMSEDDMRKVLYTVEPHAVYMYVPLSIKDTSSDNLLSNELEKVRFVYKLSSPKDFLLYENATGFRVLGSVIVEKPYLPLLKALNPQFAVSSMLNGDRAKAYIKKLVYDMCLLRDVDTFNLAYSNSQIKFAQSVDSVSVAFEYNSRELLRLSTAGNYHLDSGTYSRAMKRLDSVKKEILRVCKDSYKSIYNKVDDESKFETDRRFKLARQVISETPVLSDIARRIRHTVMQSLIDDSGAIREDVTMFQINELMNRALLKVIEHIAKELLGDEFIIDDEVKDNPKIKKEFLGGSYESFVG